jgi:hypothetical protein
MVLIETLSLVNFILSVIAVIAAWYLIPKMHNELVTGWRFIIIALVVFAFTQLLILVGNTEGILTALNTIFIVIFIVGLFIHLTKIIEHSSRDRRR